MTAPDGSTAAHRGGSESTTSRVPRHRVILLVTGGVGLIVGTYTGLARAGYHHRFVDADLHGLLMVLGFLGTLIALERAVALGRRWGYLGPACSGLAVVILPVARPVGGGLLVVAGVVVTATYVALLRRGPVEIALVVMGAGAVAWIGASALWLTGVGPVAITPLLAAFLVLTIVGERLELSRLTLPSTGGRRVFVLLVCLFGVGAATAPFARSTGLVLGGLGLVGQVLWLARYDIARYTIRRPGSPRFAAICMLAGYLWLAVSGLLWIAIGLGVRGPLLHDALVHALFLGFVLSMVMGHAPIIVPAVLRTPLVFLPVTYVPLVLLHVSVAARVVADLAGSLPARELALHGNVVALALFIVVTVLAVRRSRRTGGLRPPIPGPPTGVGTTFGSPSVSRSAPGGPVERPRTTPPG